jgi:hypothetical protein
MIAVEERYSRQRDIVPPERIAACQATVIGVEDRVDSVISDAIV